MLLMSCSHVILRVIKMTYQSTRIIQANLVHYKHKQKPQDVALHKPYLKVLYHNYVLLLMDLMIILMDNFNMAQVLSHFLCNQLWAYYMTPEMLQLLANQIFQVLLPS